jgi:hypothetical protein
LSTEEDIYSLAYLSAESRDASRPQKLRSIAKLLRF